MAQDDLIRLHSLDFQAKKTIVSGQMNAELDQLIATSNTKASRVINENILQAWSFAKGINVASSSPSLSAGSFWYDPLATNFKGIAGSTPYTFGEVTSFIDVNTYGTDATAFVNALNSNAGKIVLVPNGTYNLSPTLAQVPTLLGGIFRLLALGTVNITLPVGNVALSSVIPIANAYPSNIGITGATPIALSGVTWQATSGSSGNYSIVLNVPSTTGLAVGQLARLTPTAGTGSYLTLQGAWLITNVDTGNSRITIKHTLVAGSFPTFTLANANLSINTSTLTFTGSSGFLFNIDSPLKAFYQISIVGDYNLATLAGTSGTYGIYSTDTANLTLGTAGQSDCRVAIQGFGEHGLYLKGTSAGSIGGVHSTGNRQAGVYSEGATLTGSSIVSAGNGLGATVLTQGGVDALASRVTTVEDRATALETLTSGYIDAPVPTYSAANPKRVNFNGPLTARTQDNTTNIALSSASRNLDLATNGANGLADGLTVANNTWYYVYAYSGGYVASTTNGASTLTIGTVVQKVVQLPLSLRTDGSANILPFYMDVWRGKSSRLRYKTTFYVSGSITATTLIGLVSSATYSAFSLASFVPPLSTTAILLCGSRGTGAGYIRATGETPDYGFDLVSSVHFTELQVPTNTSQSIDARITSNGMDLAVVGYSVNL